MIGARSMENAELNAVDPEQFFLTVEQVARRYNVSKDTIWRWKRSGNFPTAVSVGPNCTRWRFADLLEYEAGLQACFVTDFSFYPSV